MRLSSSDPGKDGTRARGDWEEKWSRCFVTRINPREGDECIDGKAEDGGSDSC